MANPGDLVGLAFQNQLAEGPDQAIRTGIELGQRYKQLDMQQQQIGLQREQMNMQLTERYAELAIKAADPTITPQQRKALTTGANSLGQKIGMPQLGEGYLAWASDENNYQKIAELSALRREASLDPNKTKDYFNGLRSLVGTKAEDLPEIDKYIASLSSQFADMDKQRLALGRQVVTSAIAGGGVTSAEQVAAMLGLPVDSPIVEAAVKQSRLKQETVGVTKQRAEVDLATKVKQFTADIDKDPLVERADLQRQSIGKAYEILNKKKITPGIAKDLYIDLASAISGSKVTGIEMAKAVVEDSAYGYMAQGFQFLTGKPTEAMTDAQKASLYNTFKILDDVVARQKKDRVMDLSNRQAANAKQPDIRDLYLRRSKEASEELPIYMNPAYQKKKTIDPRKAVSQDPDFKKLSPKEQAEVLRKVAE